MEQGNGLLGRPVEWIVLDDQSKPEVTRSLYEKLITVDKVDLLMGPYATGAILAAMGVAQRYQRILPHHSFGMPHLAKYEAHFPTAAFGPEPNKTVPTTVFNALAATANPPKTVAILTSKFPSAQFLSSGAKEVAEKRGLKVVLYLEYEFGTRDWAAMAARVKDVKPDLLWVGALGLDGNQLIEAMKKLDYMPPRHFHLFPAPGPLALSPDGNHALSVSVFEEHPPFMANPKTARLVGLFHDKAAKANVPYANVDTQVGGVVRRLAGSRRRRDGDEEPRRQGARAVAARQPGRHDDRQAALRRPEQLRGRPLQGEAGAGRQVGRGVAEGVRPARRQALRPDGRARADRRMPSLTLLGQSVVSGLLPGGSTRCSRSA